MKQLPTFKGYTVDERLSEFRKVELGKEIETIGFLSEKGQELLNEYHKARHGMMILTKEIRQKLPPLYSQENVADPVVVCKFFYPDFSWTWYAIEFDGEDTFYGYVAGDEPELGYFLLSELMGNSGKWGLPIERDRGFEPTPLSEVRKLHE
jgi:hypothetical protein